MKILMMGPQACGKGTQATFISEFLTLPVVVIGNLLRGLPETHPHFKSVHAALVAGELVQTDLAASIINERISSKDCINGFILDGWGRRMADITYLDPNPDKVFVISIPREESIKRISGRRICPTDGKVYNIYTMKPTEITCSVPLVQREDDKEAAINRRLEIYATETSAVIEMFRERGVLIEIDGLGTPDEVFARIKPHLRSKKVI